MTYDQLAVNGTLTLGGTSILSADLTGLTGEGLFSNVVTYGSLAGSQFSSTSFNNAPPGLGLTVNYGTTPDAIDVTLSLFAVTEVTLTPASPTTDQILAASVPRGLHQSARSTRPLP